MDFQGFQELKDTLLGKVIVDVRANFYGKNEIDKLIIVLDDDSEISVESNCSHIVYPLDVNLK